MGFSVDDKCKKLAKDPRAAAVVSKYSPGFTTDPQMKMVLSGVTGRCGKSFTTRIHSDSGWTSPDTLFVL